MSNYIRRLRERVGHDLLLVPSVTILTFDDQGRVLLVKHAEAEVWVAPGGSIEPGEAPADAAVREMWEETGLLIEPAHVLGVYGGPGFRIAYANGDAVAYVTTVFEGHVVAGALGPDGVETLDARYFCQADLASLKLPAWARIVLADAFDDRRRPHFKPPTWKPPASTS